MLGISFHFRGDKKASKKSQSRSCQTRMFAPFRVRIRIFLTRILSIIFSRFVVLHINYLFQTWVCAVSICHWIIIHKE